MIDEVTSAWARWGSGIPLDCYSSDDVAQLYNNLPSDRRDRFVVGLGGPQGPRKLELARDRAAGAVPLLVTPQYTADARRILGAGSTLVIDQLVVLDSDPARARETARGPLRFLTEVAGYRSAFLRMGLTAKDISRLSDRLVDALLTWGDREAIAARVHEQQQAGADHVVVSVLHEGRQPSSIEGARQRARLLVEGRSDLFGIGSRLQQSHRSSQDLRPRSTRIGQASHLGSAANRWAGALRCLSGRTGA